MGAECLPQSPDGRVFSGPRPFLLLNGRRCTGRPRATKTMGNGPADPDPFKAVEAAEATRLAGSGVHERLTDSGEGADRLTVTIIREGSDQ